MICHSYEAEVICLSQSSCMMPHFVVKICNACNLGIGMVAIISVDTNIGHLGYIPVSESISQGMSDMPLL